MPTPDNEFESMQRTMLAALVIMSACALGTVGIVAIAAVRIWG